MSKKIINTTMLGAAYGCDLTSKVMAVINDKIWLKRQDDIVRRVLPAAYTTCYDIKFSNLLPIGTIINVADIQTGKMPAVGAVLDTESFDLNVFYDKCKLGAEEYVSSGLVEIVGAGIDYSDTDRYFYIVKPCALFTDGKTNVKYLGATISYRCEQPNIGSSTLFPRRTSATVIKVETDYYWVKDNIDNLFVRLIAVEDVQTMDICVDELHSGKISLDDILPLGSIIGVANRGIPVSLLFTTEHYFNREFSEHGQIQSVQLEPAHEMGYVYDIVPAPKTVSRDTPRYRFQLVAVNS